MMFGSISAVVRRLAAAHPAIVVSFATISLAVGAAKPVGAQSPVTAAWDPNNDGLTVGYVVSVGVTSGAPLVSLDVGATTSVALPLPPGATYFLTVSGYNADRAPGPSSAELVVDLSSRPGPPASIRADVNGPRVSLSWTPPTYGGVPAGYLLSVGTTPGSVDLLANYPVGTARSISGDLPPGSYFAQLHAVNVLGVGAPVQLRFDVGGGYQPLPPSNLQARWTGSTVTLTWARPTGPQDQLPTAYVIEAGSASGTSNLAAFGVGNVTAYSAPVPPGTYYVRVRGVSARGVSSPSNEILLRR